jgi:hypothetical protein
VFSILDAAEGHGREALGHTAKQCKGVPFVLRSWHRASHGSSGEPNDKQRANALSHPSFSFESCFDMVASLCTHVSPNILIIIYISFTIINIVYIFNKLYGILTHGNTSMQG